MTRPAACFFARIKDKTALDRIEFYSQDIQILSDLGYEVRVATTIREIRPADLFFVWWWTWAFFPVAFAKSIGSPALVTGTFDGWLFPQRAGPHRLLIRAALQMAEANIFVSDFEMRETCRLARVTNPQYSPHCTFTDYYTPAPDERAASVLFSLISNGSGNAQRKCLAELVDAAAIIARGFPQVRFFIAGEQGALRDELEQRIVALGISRNVRFLGRLTRDEKLNYMRSCTLYLQPSRYEGFGLAILEAMSCGAPVISSAVGAVPEVGGAAIRYVDGTSPQSIATAVCDLLSKPADRATMSSLSRDRAVSQFSYQRRRDDMARILGGIRG